MITPAITAIAISIGSYHFHQDPTVEYHQINPGVILEIQNDYVAGVYRNSFGRATGLFGYRFRIAGNDKVRLGAIVAGCTGYHAPVCGAFSFDWGYLSAILTPPIGNHTAAVGISIRIPLSH